MFRHLDGWLRENGVSYDDVGPDTVFLGEQGNVTHDN
jgi:hypothetical protein